MMKQLMQFLVEEPRPKISVRAFNTKWSRQLNGLKYEYGDDIQEINEYIAGRFIMYIAEEYNIEIFNRELESNDKNNIKIWGYGEDRILLGFWIYVNDRHKVIRKKTDVELLDTDYNLIHGVKI